MHVFTRVTPLMLLGLLAAAGEDTPVFRSDVALVRVDAQVVDRDNRAITSLQAKDFVLLEEGRQQQIRNFGTVNMPLDLVLLLDVSASMRPHVERIASAAHEAFRVLGDNDRVAMMVFDRSTRLRAPFRSSRDDVEREFQSLLSQERFNGGTDITRGMLDAAKYLKKEARREARRAIVIVTDDQTERNRDEAAVEKELTRADAVMSALIAPDAMRHHSGYPGGRGGGQQGGGGWPGGGGGGMGGPLGGIILGRRGGWGGRPPYGGGGGPGMGGPHTQSAGTSEIARESGGDSMAVDEASALETTLARIRQRYALHFYLPAGVKPGDERNIEVQLADAVRQRYPGAEVRYRRVYLAPNAANAPEPTEMTRVPADSSSGSTAAAAQTSKRRPAVNEPGSDSPQGGWPQVGPQPGTDSGGGWPRVKPGQDQ